MTEGRKDGMTEGRKDGMTDKANTKCPLAILWRGHKKDQSLRHSLVIIKKMSSSRSVKANNLTSKPNFDFDRI